MFNINFAYDWKWTADRWNWKQSLYQLSHNHCPNWFFGVASQLCRNQWPNPVLHSHLFTFWPRIFQQSVNHLSVLGFRYKKPLCKHPCLIDFEKSGPIVDVIKLILEEISISTKLRNWIKFVLMSEPAQKCKNYVLFKQNYTLELFVAFKMAYSCCFSIWGNLDFQCDQMLKSYSNYLTRCKK